MLRKEQLWYETYHKLQARMEWMHGMESRANLNTRHHNACFKDHSPALCPSVATGSNAVGAVRRCNSGGGRRGSELSSELPPAPRRWPALERALPSAWTVAGLPALLLPCISSGEPGPMQLRPRSDAAPRPRGRRAGDAKGGASASARATAAAAAAGRGSDTGLRGALGDSHRTACNAPPGRSDELAARGWVAWPGSPSSSKRGTDARPAVAAPPLPTPGTCSEVGLAPLRLLLLAPSREAAACTAGGRRGLSRGSAGLRGAAPLRLPAD